MNNYEEIRFKKYYKKSDLKNITNGIAESFISRNNDVGGYWGIGKIIFLIEKNNVSYSVIDILNCNISPHDGEFIERIKLYKEKIIGYLSKFGEKAENIKSLQIQTFIYKENKEKGLYKVTSIVEIIHIDGRTISSVKTCYARKHSPKREMKSTRIYN